MFYNFDNESCLEPQGCEDENGLTYDHGVQWSTDPCTLCSCENGEISCITIDCAIPECEAPNYLQDVQGQCCPVCVEVELEADCTVQNIPIELNVKFKLVKSPFTIKHDLSISVSARIDMWLKTSQKGYPESISVPFNL